MASYKILKFKASETPLAFRNMIFGEFLRSLRFGNEYFKLIDAEPYFQVYHAYFSVLLNRPEALIKIAVLTDDDDVALGWSLTEPDKVHFVYVKKDYRHKPGNPHNPRIGSSLVSEPFSRFSHITKKAILLWPTKFPNAKFNPFC